MTYCTEAVNLCVCVLFPIHIISEPTQEMAMEGPHLPGFEILRNEQNPTTEEGEYVLLPTLGFKQDFF